jgi:CHAT domain-containing protein
MACHLMLTRITGIFWPPLALLVALPVGALERVPAPSSRSAGALLAQAKAEIPAEVQGWVDGAVAAYQRGDPAEALRLQHHTLEWTKAQLGPTHPFRAQVLNDMGLFMSAMGRREEALVATGEAVKISRELAKNNLFYLGDLAMVLSNLGQSYTNLGRSQEALAPTEEAVKLYRDLAKTNPAVLSRLASALNSLGGSFLILGRRQEGLKSVEEAEKIYRDLAKTDPAYLGDLAMILSNLGGSYTILGRRQEGLESLEEAVMIRRELAKINRAYLGSLAKALNNLGGSYSSLGRRKEAMTRTEEAVKIFRELAKTDPAAYLGDLDLALINLGIRYRHLGRHQEALGPTEEAVKVYRELAKTNPAYLDDFAFATTSLSAVLISLGNPTAAVPLLREAMASEARFLQQQLPLMAESRRQAMVITLGSRWQQPFSLAKQGSAGADLALFTRLNRHAPLQDIERRQGIAARASGPARGVLDRLQVLTTQLATPSLPIDKRQQAKTETEQLQRELVRLLPEFQPRLVEPSAVALRLPADGLLVEFQRFAPYDPRQPEAQQWGSPRYLALLLAPSGQMQTVDLGPAEALEKRIAAALQRTRDQVPEAAASWGQVADAVFGPLQSALAGRRRLLISPDGELHRVPFSALALLAASSNALPAGVTLQTIGSGRDLVPVGAAQPKASAPLVLAEPTTTGWPPLPAAANEGMAVAASLRTPLLQGPAARVGVLEQARGPRLIHVAGHGYFDDQAKGDPLLASGLVLAGADMARWPNRVAASVSPDAAPRDDGYLTAKEAARLQLDGTELVVLSACETGRGMQRSGEGVFGLQRALTVAGARGTLLSLWKVPDEASQTFMERFYVLLNQGMAPDQAVRQVQEEFRSQPTIGGKPKAGAWSDPFYWAAWQYSGVPSDGKR